MQASRCCRSQMVNSALNTGVILGLGKKFSSILPLLIQSMWFLVRLWIWCVKITSVCVCVCFLCVFFVVSFTEDEKEQLRKFTNRTFLLDKRTCHQVYLSLVDILLAYCYEVCATEGEKNVSSSPLLPCMKLQ